MKLARVLGNVVGTVHHPGYDGRKLMVVRGERPDGSPEGSSTLAIDLVQAGPGDRVLVLKEGTGVRQMMGDVGPIRSVIVGIVDDVDVGAAP